MNTSYPENQFQPAVSSKKKTYLAAVLAIVSALFVTAVYFFSPLGPSDTPPKLPEFTGSFQGKLDSRGILKKSKSDNKIFSGGKTVDSVGYVYGFFENSKNYRDLIDNINVSQDDTSIVFMTYYPTEDRWITTPQNIYVGTKKLTEAQLSTEPLKNAGLLSTSYKAVVNNFNQGETPNKEFKTMDLEKGWQLMLAPKNENNDYSFYENLDPQPSSIWEYSESAPKKFIQVPTAKLDTKINNYIHWVKFDAKPVVVQAQQKVDPINTKPIADPAQPADPEKDKTIQTNSGLSIKATITEVITGTLNPDKTKDPVVDNGPALSIGTSTAKAMNVQVGTKDIKFLDTVLTNNTDKDIQLKKIHVVLNGLQAINIGSTLSTLENIRITDGTADISKPFKFDEKNSKLITVDVNKTVKAKSNTTLSIIADIRESAPEGDFALHIGAIAYMNGSTEETAPLQVKGEAMSVKVAPGPKVSLKLSNVSVKNLTVSAGDKNKLLSTFQINTDQEITLTEFSVQVYNSGFFGGPKIELIDQVENPKLNMALFQTLDKSEKANSTITFKTNNTIPTDIDYPVSFIADIKDTIIEGLNFNIYAVNAKYKDSKGKEYTVDLSASPIKSNDIAVKVTEPVQTTQVTKEEFPQLSTAQMVLKNEGPTFAGEYYYWIENREISLYINRVNFAQYNSAKISTYACPDDFVTSCNSLYSCNLRFSFAAKDNRCQLKEYAFENYSADLNYSLVWPNEKGTMSPVLTRQLSKVEFYNKDDSTIVISPAQFISIWINKFNIPQDYSEMKVINK
ncbi:hypothetical protein COU74_01955 [Candidatus Peregrinibacteria bacterium CG10_big_fil_rev_8_21_14_0_10_36_19]|nr:MAG: hypothetical protein COU74_01955 [Candidatus Peregrinibacteria bacterium CG10_big_fil_rev_8_21_14_0_10_36_19]